MTDVRRVRGSEAPRRATTLGLLIVAGLAVTFGGGLTWRAAPSAEPVKVAVGATAPPPPASAAAVTPPGAAAELVPSATPLIPVRSAPASNRMSAPPRFALELGPFAAIPDIERLERQLDEAGFPTTRVRQPGTVSLYALVIERVGTPREAQALVDTLREQGFSDALVLGDDGPLSVRVGPLLPLRGAVSVAERLRGRGHAVRIASQAGDVVTFLVRHGAYAKREEAVDKGAAFNRLGLTPYVVQVRDTSGGTR